MPQGLSQIVVEDEEEETVSIHLEPYVESDLVIFLHASAMYAKSKVLGPFSLKSVCSTNSEPNIETSEDFRAEQSIELDSEDVRPVFIFNEFES